MLRLLFLNIIKKNLKIKVNILEWLSSNMISLVEWIEGDGKNTQVIQPLISQLIY